MTPILDHGSVELVEFWGSDERIIESARMSTNKGFINWENDQKLLNFLYRNNHTTPFEMCGATIEIQAPIFVFREWHRHRTQSYNEMSARYIPLPDVNYTPSIERLLKTSTTNKQAQGLTELTPGFAKEFQQVLDNTYAHLEFVYQEALTNGIPKELARLVIPVGRYSKMRASANLLNWIRFLRLRLAPNAQWEIQEYARGVRALLLPLFPRTIELLDKEMTNE